MDADALSQLTQGLGDDFWSAVPTPDSSPVKPKPSSSPSSSATLTTPTTPTKFSAAKPALSSTLFSATNHDLSEFLQGSEHWNLDDDLLSPVKAGPSKPPKKAILLPRYVPDSCTRCVVTSVADEYVNNQWRKREGCVVVVGVSSEEIVQVYLCDDWFETDVRTGTFTPASYQSPRTIHITCTSNLFILHPDLLTTATALSTAPQCRRKPLLSGLIRATGDITPALVYGSVLHEVMQRCLLEDKWEPTFLETSVEEAVQDALGDLVKLGVPVDIAKREITERARGLVPFRERYMGDEPKPDGALTNTRSGKDDAPALLAITKLLGIEEDIWSPTYGLKGKIDATVQATIIDPPSPPLRSSYSYNSQSKKEPQTTSAKCTSTPMPLELKTGRTLAGMEHRAQTLLYTLLLSERYGVDVQDGLLFYSQSEAGDVVRVPRGRNEIRALIGVRNELAAWAWRRVRKRKGRDEENMDMDVDGPKKTEPTQEDIEHFLPAPIDDERACTRCYALDTCLLFRKTHPDHSPSSSTSSKQQKFVPPIPDFLKSVFSEKTGHLTPTQTAFFRKWEGLLAVEERDLIRFKRELWTLGSEERERRGRCWGGMVLAAEKPKANTDIKEGLDGEHAEGEWTAPQEGSKIHQFTYAFRRSESWIVPPSLSQHQEQSGLGINLLHGHLNVGDPVTVSVEPNMIALARGYILRLNPEEVVLGVDRRLGVAEIRERLRVSRSESLGEEGQDEEVVFRIDKDELFGGMARVRGNLAHMFYADGDRKRLQLVVDLKKPRFEDSKSKVTKSNSIHKHLNPSQLNAMDRVLRAEDYALILGMPGTGKTTVVAALIRELVARGKTVLLSSYTHSAVDTILMRLMNGKEKSEGEFGILRLGNVDKVHPDVRKYTLAERRKATSLEQYELQIMAPPVVATTCLSIDQLPRQGGLDVSLFRRLSEAHPEAVVDLRFQYRMNADIMLLSNRLIYGDRLRCGNEVVAKAVLELRNRKFVQRMHRAGGGCGEEKCWLDSIVNESCKAVFVDTDAVPALESRVGDLVQNTIEGELVHQLTETLIHCGVRESQIGIISLYRQQVKLLHHLLQARKSVEILTADKSQGRDKDCIIISLVRANEGGHIGELVKDWRRMNVSFTRARKKLVIFGSRKTLKREPLLASFFELMEGQGWILPLLPGAAVLVGGARRPNVVCKKVKKENLGVEALRPVKKAKVGTAGKGKSAGAGAAVLKGRPILKDLVENEM
ncbi:Dna2-domain-containing protein [Pholiota conissans]|uniref:DNA replication ATP-dependent helicase/nuclease DNA2 n=1 Tax=Pholiota conissans TaxID=109636 RepID=A0A9P6CU48_9AGAR|nr:Dna2-domain-containing protein [Pholiota conissans]